jgi:glycogenin glucosyltransferase
VLAHSLRDAGSTKKLACMIAQDNLSASSVEELQVRDGWHISGPV